MDLPEPVRRYLDRAAPPGLPAVSSANLEMEGRLRLGPEKPWMRFRARQRLTESELRWSARTSGMLSITGFDRYEAGFGEMNWRLWGLIPVARGSGPDVTRSARGRLAGERTLLPGSLDPSHGVTWTHPAPDRITASFHLHGDRFHLDLLTGADGGLVEVRYLRWTNQNAGGQWGFAPFVVRASAAAQFDGYTIPTVLSAGWRLGEPDGFVFIEETITAARFG
jgi:hypothetical protein